MGNLGKALVLFKDPAFAVDTKPTADMMMQPRSMVCILANLDRILILRSDKYRDEKVARDLLEVLEPICRDHPNTDIKVAFHIVSSLLDKNQSTAKTTLIEGIALSKQTNNTLCTAIMLNLMRSTLYESVVGEQAMKSAKAASLQAKRSGSVLWMSVAEAMLSKSHEVHGQHDTAIQRQTDAASYANEWFQHMAMEESPEE